MENQTGMLIGLGLTMLTCFGGLLLAYFSYKKYHKPGSEEGQQAGENNNE